MLKKNAAVLLMVCLLLSASPVYASASEAADRGGTIVVQLSDWSRWKSTLQEQQVQLNLLESELMLLEKPSAELISSLAQARQQLQIAQSELTESKSSLTSAQNEISSLSQSLKTLKLQLEKERSKAKLSEKQHTFWGIIAGALIVCLVR